VKAAVLDTLAQAFSMVRPTGGFAAMERGEGARSITVYGGTA
jgi:hypothetical protein